MILNILYVIAGVLIGIAAFLLLQVNRERVLRYHVKVKFAHGISIKLVLNDEQYQQFKQWLERPEGLFDIGTDDNFVSLNRQNVCCVEVKKR